MIVGFDCDDATIFDRQLRFLREARISFSMSGMLTAIPKTPLYDRLAAEGRIDRRDPPEFGTNVIPLRMTGEELRDGYVSLLNTIYEPESYFERAEALFLQRSFDPGNPRSTYWRRHPLRRLQRESIDLAMAAGLYLRLMAGLPSAALRREYRRRVRRFLGAHRRPGLLVAYLYHILMHYHAHTMARRMVGGEHQIVNTL